MGMFRRSGASDIRSLAEVLRKIYVEEGLPIGEVFEARLRALNFSTMLECSNGHIEIYIGEGIPVQCRRCGRLLKQIEVLGSSAAAELRIKLAIEAHSLYAKDCSLRSDFIGAERSLTRILILKPDQEDALHNRAEARIASGNLKGGIEDCDAVVTLNPSAADTFLTRGGAKAQLGDYKGAIQDTNKALALGIKLPIAYYNRAMCFYLSGNPKDARGDLERFLALAPHDPRAPSVREILKDLQ
jgi:tetratricopeptide (TPR) repeat protein